VSSTAEGEKLAKDQLALSYDIKDLGDAKLILEMCIERNKESGDITLSQKAYCEQVLRRFNMSDCAPASTPLPSGLTLSSDDLPETEEEEREMKKIPYHEALESLMWLQVAT